MGVGMVAVVDGDDVNRVLATLEDHDVEAWVCGEVGLASGTSGAPGEVVLEGSHPGW
jgi:phosphoribosylformylglycinamidine cyclo-ligase